MKIRNIKYFLFPVFLTILLLFSPQTVVKGERLSFKTYSAADGLASDDVNRIVADSHGFLWFCTVEGLSRFDGYKFKNYLQEQGLPHRVVYDLLETPEGDYIIATPNGLAVFNPKGTAFPWSVRENRLDQTSDEPPLFKTYFIEGSSSQSFYSLASDGNGIVYTAKDDKLYRFVKKDGEWSFEKIIYETHEDPLRVVNKLFADSRGDIWIAASSAIYRMSKNGDIKQVLDSGGNSVFEDRNGNIWVDSGGNEFGIRILEVRTDGSDAVLKRLYTTKDGLVKNSFSNAIAHTRDGRIFVTSQGKLLEFLPNAPDSSPKFKSLDNVAIRPATDRSGNVWFVLPGRGVGKFAPKSFVTFDERDGMPNEFIRSLFTKPTGDVFATGGMQALIHSDGGGKFENIIPFGLKSRFWTHNFLDLLASNGEWWVPSSAGLRRYPKVEKFADLAKTPPKKVYTAADGLFGDGVYAIFEDSRGDIWISAGKRDALARFERSTEKIHRYGAEYGLPVDNAPVSFGEDAAGNIWSGYFNGELSRFKNGTFRVFSEAEGMPRSVVGNMLSDKAGRLWVATASRGLFRIDNPNDESPTFVSYSIAEGLSSNRAFCVTEDNFGRIYVGTGRGINRIEPGNQRVKVFTQADGLPGNIVSECGKAADGKLWFSSNNSLIQFEPEADAPAKPPPIFIDSLSINGNSRTVSELGEAEIKDLEMGADEKQIQVGFFAISLDKGETLRYQYKLAGQNWSPPSEQRTISLNLSSGSYNFQVRAVNSDGVVSEKPATVSFKINPPFWRTWWFVVSAFLLIGGGVLVLDRYRVSKTRLVENALDDVKESENRFRTLADTASDAILTVDGENTIIFVNQAIEKVFGYLPSEMIGQKLAVLIPDEMPVKEPIGGEEAALTGIHKSGRKIPLEVSFGKFERDGETYFTAIARDISERLRAETDLQQAREEKFRELEKVRTRIATDLHDDIGSSLTQIAVLTEVARGQVTAVGADDLSMPLDRIKNVSKDLVAVMSDVVWAINPQKDFLHDLVQRMRRFGSDIFTGRGIRFEFSAPDIESDLQLGANIRREIFAIFKESVNNAVKYSECTIAAVKLEIENDRLLLEISDNGKGFETSEILSPDFRPEMGGNGLVNMRRRADDLGGSCEISSEIGRGTTIKVSVPLHFQKTNLENRS